MKPSRDSMVSPRRVTRAPLAWACALLCLWGVCRPALAQDPTPAPPTPPAPTEEMAERWFRELFQVTMELSRISDEAERRRLEARRAEILEEIRSLRPEEREGRAPRPQFSEGTDEILRALEAAGENIDWEEINGMIGGSLQELGEGMRALGQQLEDLEVELGPDRGRVGNRQTGDRMVFQIPPELHETLKEGIGAIATELEGAFRDSAQVRFELLESLDEMERRIHEGERGESPGAFFRRLFEEREPERRVVAKSVFKLSEDFEVEEDEIVQGDIFVLSGDVYVGGEVQGSVYCLLGDVWVDESGVLGQDAVSLSGRVEVDGTVHGHRFAMGELVPGMVSAGLGGLGSFNFVMHGARVALQALLLFLGFAVVGDRLTRMSQHARGHAGSSLLSGGLWLTVAIGAFAVAAVGLAVTVIGIPLVFVLALAMWLALLASYFVACEGLGRRTLAAVGDDHPRKLWVAGLVGMALLEVPTFLYASVRSMEDLEGPAMVILGVDYALKFLALAIGFGALIATRAGDGARPAAATLEAPAVLPAPPEA